MLCFSEDHNIFSSLMYNMRWLQDNDTLERRQHCEIWVLADQNFFYYKIQQPKSFLCLFLLAIWWSIFQFSWQGFVLSYMQSCGFAYGIIFINTILNMDMSIHIAMIFCDPIDHFSNGITIYRLPGYIIFEFINEVVSNFLVDKVRQSIKFYLKNDLFIFMSSFLYLVLFCEIREGVQNLLGPIHFVYFSRKCRMLEKVSIPETFLSK